MLKNQPAHNDTMVKSKQDTQDTRDRGLDGHKRALRSVARHRRSVLAKTHGDKAALALRDHVLAAPFMADGGVVAAYWPVGDEIDCRPLLEGMAQQGIICALPVIVGPGQPLIFRMWRRDTTLMTGRFNIRIPDGDSPVVTPRIVLTPLLAFDETGYRLGYGGGYYDRSLALLRDHSSDVIACGLAFSGQKVGAIPHDKHDQRLDWMVTEKGIERCGLVSRPDPGTMIADSDAGQESQYQESP